MPVWVDSAFGAVLSIAWMLAPGAALVYARHKQKRDGGFPSIDPGLGRWNAFPLAVHPLHDVTDPATTSGPADPRGTAVPQRDPDPGDPVAVTIRR